MKNGYKQTEVGVIPEDWKYYAIGNFIDLLTGFPFPSSGYSKSGIRLLRGSNVKRGVTDWSEEGTEFWFTITPEIKKYVLKESDIVIAMDGSLVGRSFAMLSKDDVPSLLLQRVARVRTESIEQKYLKAWICDKYFTKHCDIVKTSSAIPHISPADIKSFKIAIPPTKAEQAAIATALSDVDALISALDNTIAKKCLIKQGAMQELLSGKKRLAGFSGEWEVKTFGDIFDFLTTATYSRADLSEHDEIGYIHYGDIHTRWNYFLDFEKNNLPTIKSEKVKKYPLIKEGDIIMADASEDYEGISKSVEVKNLGMKKAISGLHTFLLRDNKEVFVNGFRGYIQANIFVKNQFKTLATGLKVYGVSKGNLKSIQIPIPPKEEQTAIAQILGDMDSDIEALETRRNKTQAIKQGMMQTLLTGKIRLPLQEPIPC